jgi:hypothetical protein
MIADAGRTAEDDAPLVGAADAAESPDSAGAYPRLSDEQLAALRRHGQRRAIRPGDVVIADGDRDRDFTVVLAGRVAVYEGYGTDVATCRQDAWLALPEWADASYQRSTRNALKVFHRLGVPSGSSNRKWTSPGWVFSSSQRPSGRRFARTRSIASSSRGSGVPPRRAKYSVALSRS